MVRYVAGDGESQKAWKGAAGNLAVGVKAVSPPGQHNIFLECLLQIVTVFLTIKVFVSNIVKQKHKAFQIFNTGNKTELFLVSILSYS